MVVVTAARNLSRANGCDSTIGWECQTHVLVSIRCRATIQLGQPSAHGHSCTTELLQWKVQVLNVQHLVAKYIYRSKQYNGQHNVYKRGYLERCDKFSSCFSFNKQHPTSINVVKVTLSSQPHCMLGITLLHESYCLPHQIFPTCVMQRHRNQAAIFKNPLSR